MNPVDLVFGATWALILGTAAWYIARAIRRRIASRRAARDLEQMHAIWPDPPTWKTAAAQYRLDTAKQKREEDR